MCNKIIKLTYFVVHAVILYSWLICVDHILPLQVGVKCKITITILYYALKVDMFYHHKVLKPFGPSSTFATSVRVTRSWSKYILSHAWKVGILWSPKNRDTLEDVKLFLFCNVTSLYLSFNLQVYSNLDGSYDNQWNIMLMVGFVSRYYLAFT